VVCAGPAAARRRSAYAAAPGGPPRAPARADTAAAGAFVAAALGAVRRGPGRREGAAAGLLMAAAGYSIVSNTVFVLGTILGERLFYLPTAGLCVAAAALAEPLLSSPSTRRAAAGAVLVLVAAAVPVNRHRAAEWLTPVSLFESAARVVPRSARAHMELATAYGSAGRVDEALRHFSASLAILPSYASASYNQGNILAKAGRYEEAAAAYRQSIQANPALTRAWHNLALTERIRGNRDGWIEALRGAVRSSPGSAKLAEELGEALIAAGRYAEAVAAYDDLLARGGASATVHFNRGVARHHLGGCVASVEDYRRSAASPGAPREAFTAGVGCLKELGRDEEATSLEKAAQVANRGTRR
jgi:tetratricopeptide (TPR) repeat protein